MCTSFAKTFLNSICIQPVKRNFHIFSFFKLQIGLFKILQEFAYLRWHGTGLFKNHFWTFFCKHFYYITGFAIFFRLKKKSIRDLSFVIFGHQTWNLEVGVKLPPPQRILVFKYPNRVKIKFS